MPNSFETIYASRQGPDWVATIGGSLFGYTIVRINVQGPQVPKGSRLSVYVGNINPANLVDSTTRTDTNTLDVGSRPIQVPPGSNVTVVWERGVSVAFTGTPTISVTTA